MTNAQSSAAPLIAETAIPRRLVVAWGLWDWGSAAFNAVITTFVFTVYLTSTDAFGGTTEVTAMLSWAMAGAGVLIAAFAPITGQRSDGSGRRKFWLGVNSYLVVVVSALLFFIEPQAALLPLALLLLALGTIFYEFATVNYNAMLTQISTPRTIGRVSGFGWSMGYFGGIVLLLALYFGFIHPDVGLFGVTADNGLSVRVSMLIAAAWFGLAALPLLLAVPETPRSSAASARVSFIDSYRTLGRDIQVLWRTSRHTVLFLLSSAVFRDGLAGVFTFGGVLAAGTFGFSSGTVIIFAVAANIVAGVSTLLVGRLDDRVGPKSVILVSLSGIVTAGLALFIFHAGGSTVFWVFGLLMCVFVGPAQSASRTFLLRMIPAGREGELFGLYATTGKAAAFLAPTLFALFVTVFQAQVFGILGIIIVLLAGAFLLIPVRLVRSANQSLAE